MGPGRGYEERALGNDYKVGAEITLSRELANASKASNPKTADNSSRKWRTYLPNPSLIIAAAKKL